MSRNGKARQTSTMTQLGVVFDKSAVAMGTILTKTGLREHLKPTRKALVEGYAIPMGYAPNTSREFWVWDHVKTAEFLVSQGYVNTQAIEPVVALSKVSVYINPFEAGDFIIIPPGTPYDQEDIKKHQNGGGTSGTLNVELTWTWGSRDEIMDASSASRKPVICFIDENDGERIIPLTKAMHQLNNIPNQQMTFRPKNK